MDEEELFEVDVEAVSAASSLECSVGAEPCLSLPVLQIQRPPLLVCQTDAAARFVPEFELSAGTPTRSCFGDDSMQRGSIRAPPVAVRDCPPRRRVVAPPREGVGVGGGSLLVPGDDGDAEDARLEHGSGYCYAGDSFGQGEGTFTACSPGSLLASSSMPMPPTSRIRSTSRSSPDHRVGTEKFDMGDPFAIGPPDEFAVGVHTEVVRDDLTIGEQWQHQLIRDGECSAVELQQEGVLLVHHGDGDHIARAGGDVGLFGEVQCHPPLSSAIPIASVTWAAPSVSNTCAGGAAGDGGDAVSESETAVPIRLEPGVIAVGSHSSTVSRKTANRQRMPKCPPGSY